MLLQVLKVPLQEPRPQQLLRWSHESLAFAKQLLSLCAVQAAGPRQLPPQQTCWTPHLMRLMGLGAMRRMPWRMPRMAF